ncbi:MAG: PilZ domain-containing protein [Bradyrhizobium sp.]
MIERRQSARARVIYGGVIAYNRRQSTVQCVIRNFSEDGAKVEFDNPAVLPDVIDLLIAKKNRAFTARIAWRQDIEAGLAFHSVEQDAPIPLDWARRLRACESERRELQNRIARLLSEH